MDKPSEQLLQRPDNSFRYKYSLDKMKNSGFNLIRRILLHARPYWLHIGIYFFLTLLAAGVALLKPFTLKFLIDSGFGSQPVPEFIQFFFPANFQFGFETVALLAAALAILIALVDNMLVYKTWMLTIYTGEKLVRNFRSLLFNHVQRLSLSYHDEKGASDSLYRIQWDTVSVRALLLGQLPPLLSSFITLLSMIVIMFAINWRFALIAMCIIPPLIFLSQISRKKLKKQYYEVKNAESSAMSVIHEVLNSLRVVKVFGQEQNENERFSNRSGKALKSQLELNRTSARFSFAVGMLLAMGTAFFLYIGARFVYRGEMTLGELTLVLAYLSQVFTPLQNIVKNLNEIQSSMTSIDRVFSVLDEENEVKEYPNAKSLSRSDGNFEFEKVSFTYQEDKEVLNDLSFSIRAGDRVGIMGSTGAGKSTLISLVLRLYDPSGGVIKIDDVDIKKYKLEDYRKQFSIVLQDPVLFSTTIEENIRYGRPEASDKDVIEAAKAANAHDFIMKKKDGYDALVGDKGMKLSGGERQRISIARAFIKNAPILILDEPTSSLDIKTEVQIMDAMERLMSGRTTFMITHRLDTLNSCNVILHLEGGKLIDVVRDHDVDFIAKKKAAFLNQP